MTFPFKHESCRNETLQLKNKEARKPKGQPFGFCTHEGALEKSVHPTSPTFQFQIKFSEQLGIDDFMPIQN
jgi:hypothetical protein